MKTMHTIKRILPLLCMAFALICFSATHSYAVTAQTIDAGVNVAIKNLSKINGGQDVINKAKGLLVFPSIFKAAAGVGGEYGEGALRIGNKTVGYYATAAASLGLQLGGQKKSVIIAFMDDNSLNKFRNSKGWKIGVDASVAVIDTGSGTQMSTVISNKPIVAFVFDEKGLMVDLSLNGAKVTELKR